MLTSQKRTVRIIPVCAALALAAWLFSLTQWRAPKSAAAAPVFATIIVNSLADGALANDGQCTLREALRNANNDNQSGSTDCTAGGGVDTISFSVTGTINLTSALLDITQSLTINGPGATQLTVSGNNAVRVFNIASGALNVTFSGLTIANGLVTSAGNALGAGIFSSSTTTVNVMNCTLTGNVVNTTGATSAGGAIFNNSTGTVNVTNSTLSGNSAAGPNRNGGAIFNNSNGTVSVTNSTLSANSAGSGGGIYNNGSGTVNVTNSTLSGNSASGAIVSGGGIFNSSTGIMTVTYSTLTANSANTNGGGIFIQGAGTVSVKNSLIAGNTAGSGPDVFGGFTSQGFNLIGKTDGSTGFNAAGDQTGTIAAPLDAKLAPLANNGGTTLTHALRGDSAAIDAGTPTLAPPTDQRGLLRNDDGNGDNTNAVDIGAFEVQKLLVTNTNDSGAGSLRQAITDNNTNHGGDLIAFSLAGGTPTINPVSPLPAISRSVTINGATGGATRVELNGTGVNGAGLQIQAGYSVIRNLVINRFANSGIVLFTGTDNLVQSCFLGTDVTGTLDQGNALDGVFMSCANNTIGGTTASTRNLISGNDRAGVFLGFAAGTNNQVQGNFIGTTVSGAAALGNGMYGVSIDIGANNNVIGGTAAGARNIISGNGDRGVFINGNGSTGNLVQGNFIGTNVAGTAALPNVIGGVRVNNAPNNTIGGTAAGARNLISGNTGSGIELSGAGTTGTLVQGNFIGTDVNGTAAIANTNNAIVLQDGSNNTIGGTSTAARNILSGNINRGIFIFGATATGNLIQGNFIGTDATGNTPLANSLRGVEISDSPSNTVGGTLAGAGNVIAFNTQAGVVIAGAGAVNNRVLSNAIFSNGALGIDLGNNGLTANDAGDGDSGPNNLQNFPVLTFVSVAGGNTTIQGTLNSTASTNFRVEFFSNPTCEVSGNGEGQVFLGFTNVTTNASNNATISVNLPVTVNLGHAITATATDPNGNTSEFSQCLLACSYAINPTTASFTPATNEGSVNVTTQSGCAWTVTGNPAWINITSGSSGTGNGTVQYTVAPNDSMVPRAATFTIAGNTFTVGQAAAGSLVETDFSGPFPPPGWNVIDGGTGTYPDNTPAAWSNANPCNRVIGPPFSGSFAIVDAVCAGPNAILDEQLITPPFNATGMGAVFVEFFNSFQWDAAAPNNTGDVDVSTNGGMTWINVLRLQGADDGVPPNTKIINITPFITANPANVRVRLHYYGIGVSAAPSPNSPTGEQRVEWAVDFSIYGFAINPESQSFQASGGTDTVNVTAAPGRAWTAQSNVPWIMLANFGGTGSGSVGYMVAANTSSTPRTGTITVAGNTFTVTQCPTITVNPATLPNGFVGTAYNQTLTASPAGSYTFSTSAGSLPSGLSLSSGGTLSGMPTAPGTFSFTIKATDASDCMGTRTYTVIISGNGLMFYPLPRPVRLLDTRAGQGNCDNVGTPIAGGTSITTQARVTCEGITIPPSAQAVVGNVTVINLTNQAGFLTLYPTGVPAPLAANMVYQPGQVLSNAFTVGLGANGAFDLFGQRTIDVVVDISGYYAPPGAGGLYFHPLPRPVRLLDTRAGEGNCDSVGTPIAAGASLTTQARISCEGLTIPAAAQAVVGNATVINLTNQAGFLTIYPNGVPVPLAANLVYQPNQILANAFTVSLNASGEFNIFGQRTIEMVVDVAGYFSSEALDANGPGLLFSALPRPVRLLDTRAGEGNCDSVGTPIAAGTSLTTQARITCEGIPIPLTAQTVLGNVTVINLSNQAGFLTLYPNGVTAPLAANLVYQPNQILANAFVVSLSGGGEFNIFGQRLIEAIVDVSGYFAP